jgi:hypothetical protein
MPAYDATQFNPPAPVAQVTLRNPENNDMLSNVPMLLDSGADVTLLPVKPINQLGVKPEADQIYELEGFDGSKSSVTAVRLEMLFLRRKFRGRFLIINQEWGVMGRDVLNHVPLILDGPSLNWHEQQDPG